MKDLNLDAADLASLQQAGTELANVISLEGGMIAFGVVAVVTKENHPGLVPHAWRCWLQLAEAVYKDKAQELVAGAWSGLCKGAPHLAAELRPLLEAAGLTPKEP
jgi:hypothetical protein